MTNNGKPRQLSAIIGERLRQFREESGLRQSDVAAAAARAGLSWGRSSVAAIEAGSRNLSMAEFFMLPWVITAAGGWDKPLLPPGTQVMLDSTITTPDGMAMSIAMLQEPAGPFGSPAPGRIQKILNEKGEGGSVADSEPEVSFLGAEDVIWSAVCAFAYPNLEYDRVGRDGHYEMELLSKISSRLTMPDGKRPEWRAVAVFSWGLWGHSFGTERDRRASGRDYPNRRSQQSARGHVTREMTSELEAEAWRHWPLVEGIVNQVWPIRENPAELRSWYYKAARDARKDNLSKRAKRVNGSGG